MRTINFLRISSLLLALSFLLCCTSPPPTDELDKDIQKIVSEIKTAETENARLIGGLVKAYIELRLGILHNTKAILEQKKTGINRFVNIKYSIENASYHVPENKVQLLLAIENDLVTLGKDITKAEAENARYIGGLVKAMIEARIATMRNTEAMLNQKLLLLKNDIPLSAAIPSGDRQQKKEDHFLPTPGKDIDKM